ncbi:hypothetical protein OROHE_024107 [Orobanche hederae]
MTESVPDFYEIEDDYSNCTKEEGIVELLWQNGQAVMQNQRGWKKTASGGEGGREVAIPAGKELRQGGEEQQHLFMQEDEMASWLQYPLDDSSFGRDFYADLLCSTPPPTPTPVITTITQPRVIVGEIRPPRAPPRPPVAQTVTKTENAPRLQNFVHFSRLHSKPNNNPSVATARESTVVESNETPNVRSPEPRVSHSVTGSRPMVNVESGTATTGGTSSTTGELAAGTCELTVTSSTGGYRASSSASGELNQSHQSPAVATPEDRKRKARETDDSDQYQSGDIEFEAVEAKKQARGSTSTKRSRAAEVHNLSERRRRDRINEKMRELQELIPRCNKSDNASMLGEAIEYLKSLQMQVQMMSMGYPMVPMLYPGMQQYMAVMGLGMAMNGPMVPYPSNMLPQSSGWSAMANSGYINPRFVMPQVHTESDYSRIEASNNQTESDPNFSQFHYRQYQSRTTNFMDSSYQQSMEGQLQLPHHQTMSQPCEHKPDTSKELGNPDNRQFGKIGQTKRANPLKVPEITSAICLDCHTALAQQRLTWHI